MGGFLKGKRTYVAAGVSMITAIAAWAVGDAETATTLKQISEVALPLAVAFLRAK